MSTSKTEQRRSVNLTKENFDEVWSELKTLKDKKTPGKTPEMQQKNSNTPSKKEEDKAEWKNQTVTTTDTGTDSQPSKIRTPRSVRIIEKNEQKQGDQKTSEKKREKYAETEQEKPRNSRIKPMILPLSMQGISPKGSPVNTPISTPLSTANVSFMTESQDAGRLGSARKMKKEASRKLTKLALNLSDALQDLSPRKNSPKGSASSAGRSSPTKEVSKTPRKKLPAEFTNALCNEATKLILKLQKDEKFQKVSPARQDLLFHATLMKILEEKKIPCDLTKLELFSSEIRLRTQNAIVNAEIDLTKEPYLESVNTIKKYLKENFGKATDRGTLYDRATDKEKQQMRLNFESYFLRDLSGGQVKLEYETDDGDIKNFDSLWDLEDFLNKGDPESERAKSLAIAGSIDQEEVHTRSRYISHFASQHMFGFMGKVGLGMLPGLPSPLKLDDGAEIIPKGDVQIRYRFKKHIDGGVDVHIFYEMQPNPTRECKTKDGRFLSIDPDARLTLSMGLYFSRDRDLHTSAIKLHAEGWNLTVPGKYE